LDQSVQDIKESKTQQALPSHGFVLHLWYSNCASWSCTSSDA